MNLILLNKKLFVTYLDFSPVFMLIIIISGLVINIIYFEFDENIPSDDLTLNIFMFIFVMISYIYA